MRASRHATLLIAASAAGLLAAWPAAAAPVDPVEVDQATSLSDPAAFVSPTGEQLLRYRRPADAGSSAYGTRARGADGSFGPFDELTRGGGAQGAQLTFDSAGRAYAIWGVSGVGNRAQQAFREPGGQFSAGMDVSTCGRFVDAAFGPGDRLAVACTSERGSPPPYDARFGLRDGLGPVQANTQFMPYVYDPFIQPTVDWGADGTMAAVANSFLTATSPPPAFETEVIQARVENAATGLSVSQAVTSSVEPAQLDYTGTAVLPDGTVAISTGSSTAGARLFLRPPGPATTFAPEPGITQGEAALEPQVDDDGDLHVATAQQNPDGSHQYWAYERPAGGAFGPAIPVPLASTDPYVPYEDGFAVAPDGSELILIVADDGLWLTRRPAGQASFESPVRIGPTPAGNPGSAVTPEGDLLAVWPTEIAPDDQRMMVGGWDSGRPPELSAVEIPERGLKGGRVAFSAVAHDAMGIRSVAWKFGDGTAGQGERVDHVYGRRGRFAVTVTATDRAGNSSSSTGTIEIFEAKPNPPSVTLKTAGSLKFRALSKKGLKVVVRADRPVKVRAAIGTSSKRVRRAPLATKAIKAAKATQSFRIKPRRRALGKPRRFKLHLQVTATAAGGGATTLTRTVKIRR